MPFPSEVSGSFIIKPIHHPDLTTLCPVVNSRITLTAAQAVSEQGDQVIYRNCSNMDNCYNRPDIVEQIPACCLHLHYPVAE